MDTPATLVCVLQARHGAGVDRSISAWQIRYHAKVIPFEGFVSADLLPPSTAEGREWKVVVRFASAKLLDHWLESPERTWLAAEAEPVLEDGAALEETVQRGDETESAAGVTEIIRSEILPGMEDIYREWSRKTQHAQAQFQGYRGVHIIAPGPGRGNEWTTLLRFDTEENLDRWRLSPERSALLDEARGVIKRTEATRLSSPFPGWMPSSPETGQAPPKWKTALLVWLGLFPLVMLVLKFLHPVLAGLNASLATFLANGLTVALTTYVMMPLLVRKFGWWLLPEGEAWERQRLTLMGLAWVAGLMVVEVLALWKLL